MHEITNTDNLQPEDEGIRLDNIPGSLIAMEQTAGDNAPVDLAIIRKAISGDKDAFSQLFQLTYRYVFQIVRHYLKQDADIYDAVQDTYMKAFVNVGKLKVPEAFFSWLRQIAENTAKNHLAANGRQESMSLSADQSDVYLSEVQKDETPQRDVSLDISSILKCLPEEQAQLLVMVYYDGMKLMDIARLLHEPPTTIYSRFHAAQKLLKKLLKARGIDRPIYAGSALSMLTTSLRDAIGTELLSAAVAQDILDSVLAGTSGKKKEGAVVARIARQQRNAAVVRLASLVVALSVGATCLTLFAWSIKNRRQPHIPAPVESLSSSTVFAGAESHGTGSPADTTATDKAGHPLPPANADSSAVSAEPGETISVTSRWDGTTPTKGPTSAASTGTTAPPAFVPDYRPGRANTRIMNAYSRTEYPSIDTQDEWGYYIGGYGESYKFRLDGTGAKIPLPEAVSFKNQAAVVGDWFYYADGTISRMRTDGHLTQRLIEGYSNFEVAGDKVYYGRLEKGAYGTGQATRAFYEYSTATKKSVRLFTDTIQNVPADRNDGDAGAFMLLGNWVVYSDAVYSLSGEKFPLVNPLLLGWRWYKTGERLYTPFGDMSFGYLDMSTGKPVTKTILGVYRYDQWEFISPEGNKLGATEKGEHTHAFVWKDFNGNILGERPAALKKTFDAQLFWPLDNGWIYSAKPDGTLYRCKSDGSGYMEYK